MSNFLRANNLRQIEVARYLGISKPFMSQLTSGRSKLPAAHIEKLKANEHGWKTEMLDESLVVKQADPLHSELAVLRARVELLERLLEEKERTIQIMMGKKSKGL